MCVICHTPTPQITLSHWLFFLGYVLFLELRLVLKLSDEKKRKQDMQLSPLYSKQFFPADS